MALSNPFASAAPTGQPPPPPPPVNDSQQPGFFGDGKYQVDASAYQLPGFAQQQQQTGQLANNVLTPTNQQQISNQQQQLTGSLFGAINGQQPSVAQQQLQQTTQGNVANSYAMAGANLANNPAAARQAMESAAQTNQQAAGQGAQLRAQEITNAQGQLGGVLGQQQSQNLQANQVAQGYLGQQLQGAQSQSQALQNQQAAQQGAFNSAASNSLGGKIIGAATALGSAAASAFSEGGPVPGAAPVSGNNAKNDTVPAMLSPAEIVLPRSVTLDADAGKKAAAFVEAIRKKHVLSKAA